MPWTEQAQEGSAQQRPFWEGEGRIDGDNVRLGLVDCLEDVGVGSHDPRLRGKALIDDGQTGPLALGAAGVDAEGDQRRPRVTGPSLY